MIERSRGARGCHSHRLYSHSCDRRSTVKPSEKVQSTVKVKSVNVAEQTRLVLQFAPNLLVGLHMRGMLIPNIQARGLGLQFKYQDFFAGKISKRSKVNGQN